MYISKENEGIFFLLRMKLNTRKEKSFTFEIHDVGFQPDIARTVTSDN